MRLPETAWRWPRVVAPVPVPHISASRGRFRRAVEQQELGHSFVDKELDQNFGEEASPAARRDESGPMTLFGTATASRREPTGELGAAAPDRAASEARAAADDRDMAVRRRDLSLYSQHAPIGTLGYLAVQGSLPHSERRGAGPPSALRRERCRCVRHHRVTTVSSPRRRRRAPLAAALPFPSTYY